MDLQVWRRYINEVASLLAASVVVRREGICWFLCNKAGCQAKTVSPEAFVRPSHMHAASCTMQSLPSLPPIAFLPRNGADRYHPRGGRGRD